MRGRSVVVQDGAELDHRVTVLISQGYLLRHQTERRATLVRQRQGRLLMVPAVLCGVVGLVLFVGASSGADSAAAGFTCLVVGGVITILRNWYLAVRRDQVTHVVIRE
ncbi:hypothetical protein [Actinophytocola sediminis]